MLTIAMILQKASNDFVEGLEGGNISSDDTGIQQQKVLRLETSKSMATIDLVRYS
jgi:hypothetical protein